MGRGIMDEGRDKIDWVEWKHGFQEGLVGMACVGIMLLTVVILWGVWVFVEGMG